MLSDLTDISDTLTRVHASYNALESLIGSSSGVSIDSSNLSFLLGSVNFQLQKTIEEIREAACALSC